MKKTALNLGQESVLKYDFTILKKKMSLSCVKKMLNFKIYFIDKQFVSLFY